MGQVKKTYEIIKDHRCASYDVETIPAYITAMKGLREGTNSLIDVQLKLQVCYHVYIRIIYLIYL